MVIVTKYHKLYGLKQHKIVILQFWRSEAQNGVTGLKIKELAVMLSAGSGRQLLSLPAAASRDHPHSLAHSSFHLQNLQSHHFNLCVISDSDPPVSSLTYWAIWITQDSLPVLV